MRHASAATVLLLASAAYSLISACGWGRPPTAPTPAPDPATTVTITPSGLSRPAIEIPAGGRLTLVNGDGIAHEMRADPHPTHDGCPALDAIGPLAPGRMGTSGPLPGPGTCGMHDDLAPQATALHLRVIVR